MRVLSPEFLPSGDTGSSNEIKQSIHSLYKLLTNKFISSCLFNETFLSSQDGFAVL